MRQIAPLLLRRVLALLGIAALAGLGLICPVWAQTQASAIDYPHLADLIVNRAWKPAPGERVVLFADAARDPGIAAPPLREAIGKAGGSIEEIAAPDARADANLTPQARADRFQHWKVLFQHAQAAIWLPSDLTAVEGQPFEHLVEASRVRSIHFHWFLPPEAADVPLIETMYQRPIEIELTINHCTAHRDGREGDPRGEGARHGTQRHRPHL